MSPRKRVVSWLSWAIVGVVACSAPTSDTPLTTLDVAETAIPRTPSSEAPAPSASVASPPVVAAPPGELPVRSVTPGKIQCETVDCDLATERCCFDDTSRRGRCVPLGTGGTGGCEAAEQERECDEAADCGGGHCCREVQHDDDCVPTERWACEAQGCGASGEPSEELCLVGSSCARGACSAGKDTQGWPRQGLCPADGPPIPCGASACASGEGCCWNPKTKTGKCVKSSDDCSPDYSKMQPAHLLSCRSPDDCRAGDGCFSSTGNALSHAFACGTVRCNPAIGILGPYLCRTKADCAPSISVIASETTDATYQLTGCSPGRDLPPGVKVCQYK